MAGSPSLLGTAPPHPHPLKRSTPVYTRHQECKTFFWTRAKLEPKQQCHTHENSPLHLKTTTHCCKNYTSQSVGLTVTFACNFGGMPTLVGAVCVSSPVGLGSPTWLDAKSVLSSPTCTWRTKAARHQSVFYAPPGAILSHSPSAMRSRLRRCRLHFFSMSFTRGNTLIVLLHCCNQPT